MVLKTLTKVGNSMAILIDKAILDLLDISQSTPLRITTDGRNLFISPVVKADTVSERQNKIAAAADGISKRYHKAFKKLAD